MSRFDRYMLSQLMMLFGFFALVLVSVYWVNRAVILASDEVIRQGHLVNLIDMLPHISLDVPRTSEELKQIKKIARKKSVQNVEKHFVLGALKRNGWNVTRAAEQTGMQRSNFQALMKKYDIRMRSGDQNDED